MVYSITGISDFQEGVCVFVCVCVCVGGGGGGSGPPDRPPVDPSMH